MTTTTTTMTETEARQYVQQCGEDEGPESYTEAAEIFAALYGRAPDADDGDQTQVWSLCCAAVDDALGYVVATGEDADEWSRHATLEAAREEANAKGPGASIWDADSYDADLGEGGLPIETID